MATRNMNGNRISTHTPHARRDEMTVDTLRILDISTHTPHARRDIISFRVEVLFIFISTHTPHARRDSMPRMSGRSSLYFNSHASCEA